MFICTFLSTIQIQINFPSNQQKKVIISDIYISQQMWTKKVFVKLLQILFEHSGRKISPTACFSFKEWQQKVTVFLHYLNLKMQMISQHVLVLFVK